MVQKGFLQFPLLIALGVIIVIAGGGAWHFKQVSKQHSATTEMQAVPEPTVADDTSAPAEHFAQDVISKTSNDPGGVITYSSTPNQISFNYPKGWIQVPLTPPDPNAMTFSQYPRVGNEHLELHMIIGEKLNMDQVVQSNAVDNKKVTVVIAGISVQKLIFEQPVRHGGSFYMREIHVAIPLPSGKFLNLLGVCQTNVGTSGTCSKAIDEVMDVIVIPSIKVVSSIGTTGTTNQAGASSGKSISSQDEPPKLKTIGFNLDYYDPATSRAGDFHFTQALANVLSGDPIYQKLIWSDYGIQDNRNPNDPTKRNVQPTFRLPLGTKVLAPIDGEVTKVEILYSNDYTIWFAENNTSTWFYELEHVINPIVKVREHVKAGQVVAEVSTHGSEHHPGFGIVEIGLFHLLNNEPAHWCPFVHFDDSIRDAMNKQILALYSAWEAYLGDDSVYNNDNYPVPGCATLEPTKG